MTNQTKILTLVAIIFMASAGCSDASSSDNPGGETVYPGNEETVAPDNRGSGNLDPYIEIEGKEARRLTVDQLRRSIPELFNGITWTYNSNRTGEIELLDGLARTLGEADYIEVTAPNEEPNPIFQKFMDDMAAQVCQKAIIMDQSTPAEENRVLVRYPEDPDANIRFLSLKLHSIYVPDEDTQIIAPYRELYDGIVSDTGRADDGWLGVCMAMLTAPEFMAY